MAVDLRREKLHIQVTTTSMNQNLHLLAIQLRLSIHFHEYSKRSEFHFSFSFWGYFEISHDDYLIHCKMVYVKIEEDLNQNPISFLCTIIG